MNEETKEILEGIAKNKYDSAVIYDIDILKLLDYITNLQEENENLKADYGSKSQVERDLLEERINKAIKYIKRNDMSYYGSVVVTKMEIILSILKGDE